MGGKNTKHQHLHDQYDFNSFGLASEEVEVLENYFKNSAGHDHKLDHKEFLKLYTQLNSSIDHHQAKQAAERAFKSADSNHDGHINFNEFVAFYVLSKSTPDNYRDNMNNYFNTHHNNGYISPHEANRYIDFTDNYFGGYSAFDRSQLDQYGDQIPIDAFSNHMYDSYGSYF